MFAGTAKENFLNEYPLDVLGRYESELYEYAAANHSDAMNAIRDIGKIDDELRAKLVDLLTAFKDVFKVEG